MYREIEIPETEEYYSFDEDKFEEELDIEALEYEETMEMVEGLREVLSEEYKDLDNEEMQEMLYDILESMSPAEAFNFGNILKTVAKGAGSILSNPSTSKTLKTILPVAGQIAGTAFGGPVGAMIGQGIGGFAAQAIPGGKKRVTRSKRGRRNESDGTCS